MTEQEQNGDGDATRGKDDTVPVVNLLDDKPETDDQTGGGHQRVADAIARLIERERGGKAIALEGSWGSGKSSVVKMLEGAFVTFGEKAKRTNKKKEPEPEDRTNHDEELPTDYLVYVFDAWKHEGDPLRVAFLRGLAESLHAKGWASKKLKGDWDGQIDRLEGLTKEIKTNNPPDRRWKDLTASAILFASVPALAAAVALSRPGVELAFKGILFCFAVGIASIPLIWTVWVLARLLIPKGRPWFVEDASTVAERLLTRQPVSTTSTIDGDGNVTSIKFEEQFEAMLDVVLSERAERRVLLVLDNLDRLDVKDAVAVWSTMRTFLEIDADQVAWAEWMWILVPYDREQMGRLWDGTKKVANDNAIVQHSRPSSFLDKTFAVRFDVPPLLLANWEKALGGYLKRALGEDLPVANIEGVVRLSRSFANERKHPPTPRHLKLFVNDIGALVRQYGDEFPLESLAAYSILRRGDMGPEEIREALRIDHGKLTKYIPGEWLNRERLRDMACLVFNTMDRDAAMELLLIGPLKESIRDGDTDELVKLLKGPGAVSIVEGWLPTVGDALKKISIPATQACLQRITQLQSEADFPGAPSELRWARLLKLLADCIAASSDTWHKANVLPSLCRDVLKASLSVDTLNLVTNRLQAFNLDDATSTSATKLAEAWSILWSEGGDTAKQLCRGANVPIPKTVVDSRVFLHYLWTDRDASKGLWPSLYQMPDSTVTELVVPEESTTNWSEDVFTSLRVLWGGACRFIDWNFTAERIQNYLNNCDGNERDTIMGLLDLLRGDDFHRVRSEDRVADVRNKITRPFAAMRKKLNSTGRWHHVFNGASTAKMWDLAAASVAEIGTHQALSVPGSNTPPIQTAIPVLTELRKEPAKHPDVVAAMAALPIPAIRGFLQNRVMDTEAAPLILSVIAKMAPESVRLSLPVPWVIEHWSNIAKLDSTAEGIVDAVVDAHEQESDGDSHALSKAIAKKDDPDGQAAICRALITRGSTEPALISMAQAKMKSLTSDEWVAQITKWGPWAHMLIALDDEHVPQLGTAYYKALLLIAKILSTEPETFGKTPIHEGEPERYMQALVPDHVPRFCRQLRDIAAANGSDARVELERHFGRYIAEAIVASPESTDVDVFVIPALHREDDARPSWLSGFLANERARSVIEAAPDQDRNSCLATIRELAVREDEFGALCAKLAERCEDLMPPESAGEHEEDTAEPDDSPPA